MIEGDAELRREANDFWFGAEEPDVHDDPSWSPESYARFFGSEQDVTDQQAEDEADRENNEGVTHG